MMKGWTGLIILSHNGAAFKAIIDALMIDDEPKRIDIILDTFATILTNSSPEEFRDLLPKSKEETPKEPMQQNWRRFSINVKRQPGTAQAGQNTSNIQESVTRTFFACTVLSLIKNGLVDVLHDLTEKGKNPRAAKLFQVMLVLADKFLSSQLCLDIHDLFDNEYSTEMNQLPLSGRHQIKKTLSILNTFYLQSKTFFKHKTATYLRVESAKTKVDTVMDDADFQINIKNSSVLQKVGYTQWDWNCISSLVYGPFRLPLRLTEVINSKGTSDFCKEILEFYKPFKKNSFCELGIQEGMMYTDLCCQLIENLLALPEGITLLKNTGFIKQLNEIMEIELLNSPEGRKDRVLSEIAVTRTLAREYFKVIGTLSSNPQGVLLLAENQVFDVMLRMIKASKRGEIIQLFINQLDYSLTHPELNKYSREILKEALLGKRNIRTMAIVRLKTLLKEIKRLEFQQFCIELLNDQLVYNEEFSTLEIIETVCRTLENLDVFISLKPNIEKLEKGPEGRDLLLRMCGRESGFNYLKEAGWIARNLKEWKEKKNLDYAGLIESSLKKVMSEKKIRTIDLDPNAASEYIVSVSPHFYGEICKTPVGCQYIATTGHLEDFLKELETVTDKAYRRALFWVIGLMGASDTGYDFIKGDDIIQMFVGYAEKANCLSLRGLSMYILSEMAKSSKARTKLVTLGWEAHIDTLYSLTYIALPMDPTSLFCIPDYEYRGSYVDTEDDEYTKRSKAIPIIEGEVEAKIVYHLARLVNPVTENNALEEIKKLRAAYLSKFSSKEIVCHIFYLLDKYRYSKKTRSIMFALVQDVTALEMNFAFFDKTYGFTDDDVVVDEEIQEIM